ncbi:MAG: TIGR03643 family protein [Bacteroidia bacterium]|nr:TIGR03643 family protein [Bacteroidia bacterium]
MAYAQSEKENTTELTQNETDRIIEMAWEDKTPFDAIQVQFGLNEADVKVLMKKELKFSSYKLWRKRVENTNTKHLAKRNIGIKRFKSTLQRSISINKIAKR